jgi:hypothetical protein
MEKRLNLQTYETLLSVEAGDFNKVPDHLTWPVITLYPLDSADTLLTLPQAKHIVVSFLNKMTPTSFSLSHFLAVNASVADWNALDNGQCAACMKLSFTKTTALLPLHMTTHISQAINRFIIETFNYLLKDSENDIQLQKLAITWLESMAKTSADLTTIPVSSDTTFMIKNYGKGLPLVLSYIDPQTLKPSGHLVIPPLEMLTSSQLRTWLATL